MSYYPQDPLEAFFQLPEPVWKWHEKEVALASWSLGQDFCFKTYWESMTRSEQWVLVATLTEMSMPSQPCPKVVLRSRATPLKTPELDRTGNCVPSAVSKLFDLNDLIKEEKRSLYPHVAFFCPTGWGKDFTGSKLISQADGETIACLIKEPEIWQKHCPQARIVCNGYDVSAIEKVLVEVNDRNESRMLNLEPKTPLNIVFSDYPSIVQGIEDITQKYIARPLRDGRSNLIRYWFFIQEGNVEALDMKGRSDLLKSITMVRGGEFAIEHAKSLFNSGLLTKQDIQFLNGCDRPCIVGNTPALII